MTTAFLLIVYLGDKIISNDFYFRSVDDCKYYASRLTEQPSVPSRNTDKTERKNYIAVCEIKKVNKDKVTLH